MNGLSKGGIALIALLLLTGCGPVTSAARVDTISFDRGQFGYAAGTAAQIIRTACKMEQLSSADCAVFAEIERNVVKQITAPAVVAASPTADMDAMLGLLMTLGKALVK